MIVETELKIPVEDLEGMRQRLAEVEAENQSPVQLVDTYYTFPWQDDPTRVIRIRESDELEESAELTFKKPASSSRYATSRHEITVSLAVADDMHKILQLLGGQVSACIEKHRDRYVVSGVPVYLDDVLQLGTFVEVGGPIQVEEVPEMRERIQSVVETLGLRNHVASSKSYYQLALESNRPTR